MTIDTKGRASVILLSLMPALSLLVGWQSLTTAFPKYEFLMGSPKGIYKEAIPLIRDGTLINAVAITSFEAIMGFLAGSLLGTSLGLCLWSSRILRLLARPYLIALGSVPAFALGPVLIFWLGTGIWSKVVLGFLSTFVIAVNQAHAGASEADPNLLRLTQAFGGNRIQQFWRIVVPSASIWVLAGIRLNIGMALLGAFVGEFLSSRAGLGYLIIVAEGLYNINQVWVGVISIIFVAAIFHSATVPVERWANRWK